MMTKNKTAAKKTEDQSVVYKVPAAFVLMIVVIYAFWKLGGYYSTVEGFTALYPMFCVQRYVFLALTAAELVLCVLLKNGLARTICRYWLAAFALLFVSSLILSIFWTGNMIVIYLLHALVYCLYMVWQLYHSEFFTFSLVTASAGVVFYLIALLHGKPHCGQHSAGADSDRHGAHRVPVRKKSRQTQPWQPDAAAVPGRV